MASTAKPHAVVIPCPGQGHIGPMMHLSKMLAAEGFTVTFVNTEDNHARLVQTKSVLVDQGLDIRFVALPDGREHGSTAGQDNIVELSKAFLMMEDVFGELVGRLLHEDPPATCIVSDLFAVFTQDVAAKFGLPRLAFWTESAATYASIMVVMQGFRPPKEASASNTSNLITCVPGTPPLKPSEMNTFLQCYDPEDFMFNFFVRPFARLGETTWIAINTFDELEHDAMVALRKQHLIYTLGPVLPTSCFSSAVDTTYRTAVLWEEDYDCLKWLDKQSPSSVLYVSFGSIAVLSSQQFEELALGLEASQQPLLWVIRADLMSGESVIFPKGYLDRIKDRACFVSWAPQLQVLAHSSTGGFLTHCGWNSTLESIAAGIPMLGWPYFADQMLNDRCTVDLLKVGLDFEADDGGLIRREEVEKKARELMEEEKSRELRGMAGKWKDAARRAVQAGGSSSLNLQQLVQEMAQAHYRDGWSAGGGELAAVT